MKQGHYTSMLTIAGSDPSGGAGIQADIRTASLLNVYPLSVVTALTAQSTMGVDLVDAVKPETLSAQLNTLLDDIKPDSVKTGMLPSEKAVEIVAETIHKYGLEKVVVDPVLKATSGASLSGKNSSRTVSAMKDILFPLADIVTPNIPEAELLLGHSIRDVNEAMDACVEFTEKFKCRSVLLKGGHRPSGRCCTDIFFDSKTQNLIQYPHSVVESSNLHGTGCVLSSSISSYLALGKSLPQAVAFAGQFLNQAISKGKEIRLGKGNGPVYLFNN